MPEIRYTLLADGTSDRALMPHLTWLLQQRLPQYAIQAELAELGRLPRRIVGLKERIQATLELYPCDLLFVHRDAEREPRDARVEEIRRAVSEVTTETPPTVCVIPVRMQEAWLLFDEQAIRYAAGNPRGKQPLSLPSLSSVENLSDPKQYLHELLKNANGLGSHRLRRFSPYKAATLVSSYIDDFAPLRAVPTFCLLEKDF
jgi:hypothetical protein